MAGLQEVLLSPNTMESVTLPMVRYRIAFEVTEPVHLPEYSGSTIRGAFGGALRRVACMTRQKDCKACPLYRSCPYTDIFETPPPEEHTLQKFSQIPNAYVIEPPNWGARTYEKGETLEFHFVLFGRALYHLALVVFAFQRAFSRDVGRGKAVFKTLFAEYPTGDVCVLDGEKDRIREHVPETTMPLPQGKEIVLKVTTPLRLQKNGRPLRSEEITARGLLTAMMRRTALIYEFQCRTPLGLDFAGLAEAAEGVALASHLTWRDWARYSNRQDRRMSLGGVVGEIRLSNVPFAFTALAACATLAHVGKNSTFGLGRVSLE